MAKDLVTLDSLKSRLTYFRNNRRSPQARIPEDIWADISILCGRLGLTKVANSLSIPAERMARKIKNIGPGPVRKEVTSGPSEKIEVVEMGNIGHLLAPPITIEFEVGSMSRVRVQCTAAEILAVGLLMKSLEGGAPC